MTDEVATGVRSIVTGTVGGVARLIVDGEPIAFDDGDSVALALARAGQVPGHGGCLCLAGDCPNCVAEVDGVAWVRTCQTNARAGMVVRRHPAVGAPSPITSTSPTQTTTVRHRHADVVVVGNGDSGRRAATEARSGGQDVIVLDAGAGDEVVGIFAGPTVIVRNADAIAHVHAHQVIVATGAAELQPTCAGNRLAGIVTARAAHVLDAAGIALGRAVAVGPAPAGVPCASVAGRLVRFEASAARPGAVGAIVVRTDDGVEHVHACDVAIVNLGRSPRDLLARMAATDSAVRVVGPAAESFALPPCPTEGTVCPCSRVEVDDLAGVWARGFHDLELIKRATLCGTGTCQGAVCLPHLRAFVTDRSGVTPAPFTARPAARQVTMGEASANVFIDTCRRTALHDEHVRLGATMDRWGGWWRPWHYGDHVSEYWAVREAVSLGDVSTLGKMIVSGADALTLLERLYPTTIADIAAGRSRYVLLLNERGHVFDDGMVCREGEDRFVLTFTSGGAAGAEMWVRDWIETWGLDVRVLDRTMSLAAVNVTGPLASELLARLGLTTPLRFLEHRHDIVAGVPCHVMRLSFTGEASYELHHGIDRSVELWRALLDAGRDLGVRPHGLQALFGLRLEKGHVIVGADTELDTTPRRIGMDWAVKMDKGDFVGRTALARTASLPDGRRLVGLTMDGAAPTEGAPIVIGTEIAGLVTSSFASPLLGQTVMLGWLRAAWSPERPPVTVTVDGRVATLTATPFYDLEGSRARA